MRRWIVITPEYGEVIPILDDGSGPMEYGCDVVEVEAETRHDAIAFGVKLMLTQRGPDKYSRWQWCQDQRSDGCSPYTGVKAEPVPEMCSSCEGTGYTDNHVTGEVECSACNGLGTVECS